MNDYVADMRQRLVQLNRLEEQVQNCRKWNDGSPSDEAIIESLRANISLSVLLHHDRLRARGRQSVAEVKHGVCSGCHMGLPVGTVAALKHQNELLKCNHCGRYIFLAEEEIPVDAASKPQPSAAPHPAKKLKEVR